MNIDDYTELFRVAFEPLRVRLDHQAERIRQGEDSHNQFSPWLICTGKGGSQQPEYLQYPDISLYRHCMDVATFAFMLFIHAWQAKRLPGLLPENPEGARKALQVLLAIAFLHDADKYREQSDIWDKSQSPELPHVQKLYDLLEIGQWTGLSVQDCFALVSRVETGRGQKNALFTPPPPDPMTDILAAMVAEGDKLTSIASRPEKPGGQGQSERKNGNRGYTMPTMVRRLVDVYNDEKRLKAWVSQYGVPDQRLTLLEFRQSPVVLHHLRAVFLEHLYYAERFPLVCLLDGERLSIAIPESFDVTAVFEDLQGKLAFNQPSVKRNHTNGELSLLHIHDVTTLVRVATDDASYEPRVLTVHINDWDIIIDYIRSWVGAVGGLVIRDRSESGKLLLPVAVPDATGADSELPERYTYALAIACALRSDAKGKLFEDRLQRLRSWRDGQIERGLQGALSGATLDNLDKNTRQAVYAMQAAMEIHSSEALHALVEHIHASFPPMQEDIGTKAIIENLKSQCGLATNKDNLDELVYASAPSGGTCLLTGEPATQPIKTSNMALAGVKASAFNNRMGHRKSLWSQAEKNYLSPAALKQQALLCEVLERDNKRATGQPLLVAMPFRSIFKPILDSSGEYIINSFMAVNEKDAGWKQILPWNLDVSEKMPLLLETGSSDFDSLLHTMYRLAMLALYSGDPVHVFIAAQRDLPAAFAFEQTPPLLQNLLRDLTVPEDAPGTVRRDRLPDLVQRLGLFRQIINTNYGHDVLSVLPGYGWWVVAWLQARLLQDGKSFSTSAITISRKVYPMEQDNQLERIAELATHVQRYPGPRASNNDRTFAFTTVLEPFTTGKQYGQSETVIIAAMAETLANALDRRDMYARGEGSLRERCQAFGREVYDFMTNNTDQGRLDARFHRFLLTAYAFLFMAKHAVASNKQEAA